MYQRAASARTHKTGSVVAIRRGVRDLPCNQVTFWRFATESAPEYITLERNQLARPFKWKARCNSTLHQAELRQSVPLFVTLFSPVSAPLQAALAAPADLSRPHPLSL
jgi:hypothetical protein